MPGVATADAVVPAPAGEPRAVQLATATAQQRAHDPMSGARPRVPACATPSASRPPAVQFCGGGCCGGCAKATLTGGGPPRTTADGGTGATAGGEAASPSGVLARLGSGRPMPPAATAQFSRWLGASLPPLTLHTDSAVATDVGARALTVGRHVAFAPGEYRPGSRGGDELLSHELAHVVQQSGGAPELQGCCGESNDTFEVEADAAARAVATGRSARLVGDQVSAEGTSPGHRDSLHDGPGLSPRSAVPPAVQRAPVLQRSACEDASALHAARSGTLAGPPTPDVAEVADDRRARDAAWTDAASTIDFALSILEHPLARVALSTLPVPVALPPGTRQLVGEVLPHVREIWELISNPVRLMGEVQAFVAEHLDGVPEAAQEWLADAAFHSMRDARHMTGVMLALGDVLGELLSNWTAPFVTAWHEFIHPFDIGAEMADLACIRERYDTGELSIFETATAVYGWVLGWVNRYAVYVGIALVAGGAVIGALGGGGVGGAGGAAAGGVGAAPGAAVGGGGGAASGAGAGWALSEQIGLGILAANAVHMLMQVVAAAARLEENDRAAAADARAARTPSADEASRRLRRDEEAYGAIAQVLLGLGIIGALVLLAAFGSQFARVAVNGLSRRYPALGRWLAEAGTRFQQSRLGSAVEEFQAGRSDLHQRLRGEPAPATRRPATSGGATTEITIGRERHRVSVRNGRIWLCSDNCGALIDKVESMLGEIPAGHPDRLDFEDFLAGLRALEGNRSAYDPLEFDVEVRVRGRRLETLLETADDPDLAARLLETHPLDEVFDNDLDPYEEEYGHHELNREPRWQRISDAAKAELEDSGWLKGRLPDADHRRRFMKWLEANHRQGEEHAHLSPGSPYAETMLRRFLAEEGR